MNWPILGLKVILLAAVTLELFLVLRMFDLVTWYGKKEPFHELKPSAISVPVLKELLEQRGRRVNDGLEKIDLFDLAVRSGVTRTEMAAIQELSTSADAAADIVFVRGSDYRKTVETQAQTAWLVFVVFVRGEEDKSSPGQILIANKTWQLLKHKMAMIGVNMGILDCQADTKWCEDRGWTISRLQLALPFAESGKPDVVGYTGPLTLQKVYGWVLETLQRNVLHVRRKKRLPKNWMAIDSPLEQPELNVILFTDQQSPPPFYLSLAANFADWVKFIWITMETQKDLLDWTNGTVLQGPVLERTGEHLALGQEPFPLLVVIAYEGIYLYGQREEECFSLTCSRDFLSHFRPGGRVTLYLATSTCVALAALDVYVYKQFLVQRVLRNSLLYLVLTVIVWASAAEVQHHIKAFRSLFGLATRASRYLAMTSLGAWLRHDVLLVARYWPYLIVASMPPAHFLMTYIKVRLVGEEVVEDETEEALARFRRTQDAAGRDRNRHRRRGARLRRNRLAPQNAAIADVEPEREPEPEAEVEAESVLLLSPEALQRLYQYWLMSQRPVHDVAELPEWRYNADKGQRGNGPEAEISRCIICQEDYEEGQNMTGLPCDHVFHYDCLVEWLNGAPYHTCPLCRR